jgi:hypothetical protein
MPNKSTYPPPHAGGASLSLKIGGWLEARATGWGVAALIVLSIGAAIVGAMWITLSG